MIFGSALVKDAVFLNAAQTVSRTLFIILPVAHKYTFECAFRVWRENVLQYRWCLDMIDLFLMRARWNLE